MTRGIVNILLGGVFIAGGLSGHLVFIGTDSGIVLAVVGGLLAGYGVWRIVKSRGEA